MNAAFDKGEYEELGKMNGIYKDGHYTVGTPIYTEDGKRAREEAMLLNEIASWPISS